MSGFEEIKAKVCPNHSCKQIIPESWTSSYYDEWCPGCSYGMSNDKMERNPEE